MSEKPSQELRSASEIREGKNREIISELKKGERIKITCLPVGELEGNFEGLSGDRLVISKWEKRVEGMRPINYKMKLTGRNPELHWNIDSDSRWIDIGNVDEIEKID